MLPIQHSDRAWIPWRSEARFRPTLRTLRAPHHERGFTLIELIIVINILGILVLVGVPSYIEIQEKAKANTSITNAEIIRRATSRYAGDMGFYPPDVPRGWDPGFVQPLPLNPDTGATMIPVCARCPADWVDVVAKRWQGPYLSTWPTSTPWGGKYDYNNWPDGALRYGFSIPPGIYAGVQRNYADTNGVSQVGEDCLLRQGLDYDRNRNGE